MAAKPTLRVLEHKKAGAYFSSSGLKPVTDFPFVTLLRERKGEDSRPTATLSTLKFEVERCGNDDVGIRPHDCGVYDLVADEVLVLDTEVVQPLHCVENQRA